MTIQWQVASRKKGMWMGGVVPLGYRAENRKLVIDAEQANIVRWFFRRYLELKSVPALIDELHPEQDQKPEDGITLDVAETSNSDNVDIDGKADGGPDASGGSGDTPHLPDPKAFRYRGPVYALLSNTIYIGKISHKGTIHDGEHEGIIDPETFDAVQSLLASQAANGRGSGNHASSALLVGLLFDGAGNRMTPSYTYNHRSCYRYYATDTRRPEAKKAERWRIPARMLEPLVLKSVNLLLSNGTEVTRIIQQYAEAHKLHQLQISAKKVATQLLDLESTRQQTLIRTLIQSIRIETDQLTFSLRAKLLTDLLMAVHDHGSVGLALNELSEQTSASNNPDARKTDELTIATFIQPVGLKRRGVESRLVTPGQSRASGSPDKTLVDAVAKAHLARKYLTDGRGQFIADVASTLKLDTSDLSRTLPLAFLSPKVTEAILNGSISPDMTLRKLTRGSISPSIGQSRNASSWLERTSSASKMISCSAGCRYRQDIQKKRSRKWRRRALAARRDSPSIRQTAVEPGSVITRPTSSDSNPRPARPVQPHVYQPPQPENNGTRKVANREGIPKAGRLGLYLCLYRETFREIPAQAAERFEEFKPWRKSVVFERPNGG
jgi:hypothetical protein